MDLVIDFGNTLMKFALFSGLQIVKTGHTETNSGTDLIAFTKSFLKGYPNTQRAIISSVIDYPAKFDEYLSSGFIFLRFTHQTPLPVKLLYETPETLGKDRMAIASASAVLYPGRNILAIVSGSCITYDFTDSGSVYHGGAISPGLDMRFKALHTFTQHLPLMKGIEKVPLTGKTTGESIRSGVINGTRAEIEGIISRYRSVYENLTVLLSGGNLNYFDKYLKNNIFAVPNLVLKGLKIILDFNEKN